jgi:hypothetical protein
LGVTTRVGLSALAFFVLLAETQPRSIFKKQKRAQTIAAIPHATVSCFASLCEKNFAHLAVKKPIFAL